MRFRSDYLIIAVCSRSDQFLSFIKQILRLIIRLVSGQIINF